MAAWPCWPTQALEGGCVFFLFFFGWGLEKIGFSRLGLVLGHVLFFGGIGRSKEQEFQILLVGELGCRPCNCVFPCFLGATLGDNPLNCIPLRIHFCDSFGVGGRVLYCNFQHLIFQHF